MTLTDWQIQVGDIVIGTEESTYRLWALDHAKPDTTAGDQPLPGEDGIVFGRDTLGGTVITIEAGIVTTSAASALDLLAAMRAAWQADAARATPGSVTTLQYRLPGREGMVFGRPRQFTPSTLANAVSGYIPVTCDWQCADHRWYGADEQVVTLGTMPDTSGGITWPITWPTTWAGEVSGGDRILNSGDSTTWPVITFRGPVATPGVSWHGTSLSIGTTLTAGQSITIDTRPWARTAVRESGGSVAGLLRGARMADMALPPGLTEVLFSGTDDTGTASCEIRWRSASSSP